MHRIKHIIICDACGKTYTTYHGRKINALLNDVKMTPDFITPEVHMQLCEDCHTDYCYIQGQVLSLFLEGKTSVRDIYCSKRTYGRPDIIDLDEDDDDDDK